MNRRQWIARSAAAVAGATALGALFMRKEETVGRVESEFEMPARLPVLKSRRSIALNDSLSPLTLSTLSLPKSGSKLDTSLAAPIVKAAADAGVTLFDTAWAYADGDGERLLGEVLADRDRSTYRLSTSMPTWSVSSASEAEAIFARQLELMRTDCIDYYSLQAVGDREKYEDVYLRGGVLRLLLRLRHEGKIRRLGVDFVGDDSLLAELLESGNFDFFRMPYNALDDLQTRGSMLDAIEMVADEDIPVMLTNPTKDGLLRSLNGDATDILYAYAPKIPAAGWALRAAAQVKGVVTVIDSVQDMQQLAEDIIPLAQRASLTDEEMRQWKRALASYCANRKINCVDCGSCMPCPYGIDIPGNFLINNRLVEDDMLPNAYGDTSTKAFRLRGKAFEKELDTLRPRASAFYCIGCGQCLPRCPQGIAIPAQMAHLSQIIDAVKESAAQVRSEI